MPVRVVLGFDMETDIGSWTPYYEGLQHGTPRILDVLAKYDVHASFFFVGEAAQRYPHIVSMVDAAGHDVGCHTMYHETVGDELFPIPGVRPLLPDECYRRLELATDAVQQVLGKKLFSFRAPRLWGSTAMINALEELGYAADATYPLYYYCDRLAPYHPSAEDWTRQGDMTILEIPNFADMTIESRDPHGRDRDQWPLFRTEGADVLVEHIDRMQELYRQQHQDGVICLYMHPWEFHEMPHGMIHYGEGSVLPDPFIVKNCGSKAVEELDRLLGLLVQRDAVFYTAASLAASGDY